MSYLQEAPLLAPFFTSDLHSTLLIDRFNKLISVRRSPQRMEKIVRKSRSFKSPNHTHASRTCNWNRSKKLIATTNVTFETIKATTMGYYRAPFRLMATFTDRFDNFLRDINQLRYVFVYRMHSNLSLFLLLLFFFDRTILQTRWHRA